MIHSVFKYMPARLEFFDNFLLRASNKSALNDPFEVRPSFEFWADLCLQHRYTRFGNTKKEIVAYLEQQKEGSVWSELGVSLYKDHGIISFTEEKDNLLMWSHYADEHRGMVIEFDTEHSFFNSDANYKLLPVMYRKSRLNKLGKHLMEPYFHKSNEWAYEKEHRLLLSLYEADTNLIATRNRAHFEQQKYITESDVSEFDSAGNLLRVNTYFGASIVYDPKFMAMFRVPVDAIKSVSFGAAVDREFKYNVIERLRSKDLNHIKSYQARVDSSDYCLRFEHEI
ncbi:DUF2971 domain-containing protein [Vibrio aestuarianus subsp. cardii]|uniref:DUF2971 domain-containing protein n=1 Tax=Vibrio aestuarianus TaxID=28171 RepID=UPI001594DE1C|nr:DUF2971 domain-containing protein [Vibrio aestuarianus]MDE1311747.1 DUF2971 domain-containing protein [Vibrio aestuarianus]NGZ19339.1 DUF2971 domain-containing protein [Vibrio aestuarianus]NGZ94292.1 DUF2971 domain-containing protein [Vibrio aestuarianus subsp. cardii]